MYLLIGFSYLEFLTIMYFNTRLIMFKYYYIHVFGHSAGSMNRRVFGPYEDSILHNNTDTGLYVHSVLLTGEIELAVGRTLL